MFSRSGKVLASLFAFTAMSWGQPVIHAVLNGASYSGNVAPGTWVSIFGLELSTSISTANTVPLQKTMGGVTVTFSGIAAPLSYISPTQINAIVPFEIAVQLSSAPQVVQVPVVVKTAAGASAPLTIALSRNSPGLFTRNGEGTGKAIAFDADFKSISSVGTGPIVLYATGLGPTNPAASSVSGGASSEPLNRVVDDVSVFIGDVQAQVLFAGLAPGFPGIYQLNVIPKGPLTDRVYLQVNGWRSNIANLSIAAGSNAVNVTGKIESLYPAPAAAPAAFSVMLLAGSFSVDLEIAPGAKPFSIVATNDGGNAVFQIDPAAGTWQVSMLVPSSRARGYDFSNSEFNVVWNFLTCTSNGLCSPFTANIVPLSDLDPLAVQAMRLLPMINVSSNFVGPNGPYANSGTLPPGGHITFPGQSIFPDTFGEFIQIPAAGPATRSVTFGLYVDGKLIASDVASYQVHQP
jgi:uncharacterized protein (TIGR03437 family)